MSTLDVVVAIFVAVFVIGGLAASLYVDKIHREHHEKEKDLPKR